MILPKIKLQKLNIMTMVQYAGSPNYIVVEINESCPELHIQI